MTEPTPLERLQAATPAELAALDQIARSSAPMTDAQRLVALLGDAPADDIVDAEIIDEPDTEQTDPAAAAEALADGGGDANPQPQVEGSDDGQGQIPGDNDPTHPAWPNAVPDSGAQPAGDSTVNVAWPVQPETATGTTPETPA